MTPRKGAQVKVVLQAASGRQLTVRVARAGSDNAACDAALEQAEAQYPGEGWKALYAL
jgi:hypothetical protein